MESFSGFYLNFLLYYTIPTIYMHMYIILTLCSLSPSSNESGLYVASKQKYVYCLKNCHTINASSITNTSGPGRPTGRPGPLFLVAASQPHIYTNVCVCVCSHLSLCIPPSWMQTSQYPLPQPPTMVPPSCSLQCLQAHPLIAPLSFLDYERKCLSLSPCTRSPSICTMSKVLSRTLLWDHLDREFVIIEVKLTCARDKTFYVIMGSLA